MTSGSAIYRGSVFHQRLRPLRHSLRYRVFSLLLDLDELGELDAGLALFAHNRWSPIAFHDRDHGPATGEPLRPWVEARLRGAGLEPDGGPIRLLCYPRIFGYVFNPLSVYFCYSRDGRLTAILYEVCNTFHERHTYVIPVVDGIQPSDDGRTMVCQSARKALYVSPFTGMDSHYDFRIMPPGKDIEIDIRQADEDGPLLVATFGGQHMPLTGRSLVRCLAEFPLLSVKIVSAIHWHALLLWLKGLRPVRHDPAAAPVQTSVGDPYMNKNEMQS